LLSALLGLGEGDVTLVNDTVANNSASVNVLTFPVPKAPTVTPVTNGLGANVSEDYNLLDVILHPDGPETVTLAPNGPYLTFHNTIVGDPASNPGTDTTTPPVNCYDTLGAMTSLGHNLQTDASCGFSAASIGDKQNITDAQLQLGPLQNNGGPTSTQAIPAGSVAVDAADNGACQSEPAQSGYWDQRLPSFVRISGSACDIGAYEYQYPAPPAPGPVTVTNTVVVQGTQAVSKINPPSIGVSGDPSKCTRSMVNLHVKITSAGPVTGKSVSRDGHRLGTPSGNSFTVRINAGKLGRGRHHVTLNAVNGGGSTTRSVGFSVCAPQGRKAVLPQFTG
jgi:hypothetical protein